MIGVLTPRKEYIQESQKVAEDQSELIEAITEKNEVIEEYLASKKSEEALNIEAENNEVTSTESVVNGIDESSPYIDLINELPSESPVTDSNENTLELANVSIIEDTPTSDSQEDISTIKNEDIADKKDAELHFIENWEISLALSAWNDLEAIKEAHEIIDTQIETPSVSINTKEATNLLSNNTTPESIENTQIGEVLNTEEKESKTIENPILSENITGDSPEEILPLRIEANQEVNQEFPKNTSVEEVSWDKSTTAEWEISTEVSKIEIPEIIEWSEAITKDTIETIGTNKEEEKVENIEKEELSEVPSEKIDNQLNTQITEQIIEETPSEVQEDESFIGKDLTTQSPQKKEIERSSPIAQPTPSYNQVSQTQTTISPEKREKLSEIVNTVKTLIARWHFIEARGMIINWLSFHKDNRDLNILLAELYERDRDYPKAEYIFKDMARLYPEDTEVLGHLASNLAIQRKYDVSYELYKKVLSITWGTEDLLYTLTHLASELNIPEDAYTYARAYLHQYPKSPEILWLMAQSQIAMNERKFAIETLIKLKNLTPYNQEIVDLIQKLVMEQELAGNFGEEK